MNRYLTFIVSTWIGGLGLAVAHEMPVHAYMTKNGFDRSVLAVNNQELFQRLGFDRLEPDYPFNVQNNQCNSYADALPNWINGPFEGPNDTNVRFRCVTTYEQRLMPLPYSGRQYAPLGQEFPLPPGATPQLRFEAWLMRGAIREDDIAIKYYPIEDRPDIDPWQERTRVFNHFYSPVTNSTDSVLVVGLGGIGSLNWAMGEADPFSGNTQIPDPMRGNHFSYFDARRAYFLALTYREVRLPAQTTARVESDVRMRLWSTALKSLGHVVHLMQDQASPQHSRGEPHNHTCNGVASAVNQDLATRTFENFINFRLVFRFNERISQGDPYLATNDCEEAKWIKLFQQAGQDTPDAIGPWNAAYPIPSFAVQRKFFTTRAAGDATDPAQLPRTTLNTRAGLGDYANRGFYTQDYQQGRYLSPPTLSSPEFALGTSDTVFVPGKGQVRLQSMYWAVPDAVVPGFVDVGLQNGRAPIASKGQWCFLAGAPEPNCQLVSMLTLRNYNQMADMLIPRATAYTTGMINFFFRGKIAIEVPVDGLFAAADHSIAHTVDSDGYPRCTNTVTSGADTWCVATRIYGFTKLRLKIRNDTAPITESGTNQVVPQSMVSTGANPTTGANAGLYAIARYHRNPCYKPDLSGERTVNAGGVITEPSNCPNGTRTPFQEISVSAPKVLTAAELNGTTATAVSFNFINDPIPINATDLIIQVVYRGQLGEETDGIAVGSYDVKEPSYVTMWNNSDWGACNGAWVFNSFTGTCLPNGNVLRTIDLTNFCVGSQLILAHNWQLHGNLTDGKYLRAAVLLDDRLLQTRARTQFQGAAVFAQYGKNIRGQVRQSSKEIPTPLAPFVVDTMYQKRGRIGSLRPILVNVLSGADAQPSNDQGPLDVGNLLPSFLATDLPNTAEFRFPDVPVSVNVTCPGPQ
jgi:hypothetical protein